MSVVHSIGETNLSLVRAGNCDPWLHASLVEPAERFMDRSGKQIRKTIVDLVYTMAGGRGSAPACLGDSIEWLHAGSLIIDDIQDASPTRRNQPSLHMEIGVPLALNAGNWMYFQSLDKLFDDSLSIRIQHRLLHHLIRTGLRCHQGQALDMGASVDHVDPSSVRALVHQISRLKTGSLVAMAATFGSVAAGAAKTLRAALSQFGMNIGIALQMRNDLDELRALALAAPKGLELRTDDLRNARITWPWAWAQQVCSADDFEQLVIQLRAAKENPDALVALANRLLQHTCALGDKVIQERVETQFRLLGEHVLDAKAMSSMRSALKRISHSHLNSLPLGEIADVDLT